MRDHIRWIQKSRNLSDRTVNDISEQFPRSYRSSIHGTRSLIIMCRYYGFLNNRRKTHNLKIIFTLQNGQRFRRRYAGLTMAELLKAVWNFDISICPVCGCVSMELLGRTYAASRKRYYPYIRYVHPSANWYNFLGKNHIQSSLSFV